MQRPNGAIYDLYTEPRTQHHDASVVGVVVVLHLALDFEVGASVGIFMASSWRMLVHKYNRSIPIV